MISPPSIPELMTIDEVKDALKVSKTSVEGWIYAREIASFKKGRHRKVAREDLVRFVMLNTIKARRPDWLTAQLETEFRKMLADIVAAQVRAAMTNSLQPA
jgi:excisionase family DNA binding protein